MKHALALSGGKDSMACLHLLRDTLDCAIFIDTGYAYPETHAMIDYAATLLPVHRYKSDRAGQQAREGIPADVVPVEWTPLGQRMTRRKAITIQPSMSCCSENLARPLYALAHELGVTHLVLGQRADESHRGLARDGEIVDGIIRVHPLERWTAQQVLDYLATQMTIPAHYVIQHSSLDCYDCTAYWAHSQDRLAWTKKYHPDYYAAYLAKASLLTDALAEAMEGC